MLSTTIEISPVQRALDIKNQEIEEIIEDTESKKSPFKKWIQVNNSNEAYKVEDWLMQKSPTAYRIFRFLASNMDKYNAVICSYKVMQEKLGIGKATVERGIRFLKEHKYINVLRTGGANVYMINKTLYWNSWGTNYAYAEFGARVIVSSSEQDEITQEEIKLQIKKRQEVVLKKDSET